MLRTLAALCGLCLWPTLARADWYRDAAQVPQLVVVDYPKSSFTDPELHAAVRELLGRIQLRVVSLAHPGDGEVVAYVHILMARDEVTISVEDARGQRPPARRSVLRGDSPAVLRETLAHVLLGLVEPLTESEQRQSSTGVDQGGALARRSRRIAGPELGIHGGAAQLASQAWSARFMGTAAVAWHTLLNPALAFELGATLPKSVNEQEVQASVWLASARVLARITPLALKAIAFDAALGGGLDMFSMHPKSAGSGTTLSGSDQQYQGILSVALGTRTRLHQHVDLVLALGVDLDPKQRKWAIESGSTAQPVFTTGHVRPYATLGIDWQLAREQTR